MFFPPSIRPESRGRLTVCSDLCSTEQAPYRHSSAVVQYSTVSSERLPPGGRSREQHALQHIQVQLETFSTIHSRTIVLN